MSKELVLDIGIGSGGSYIRENTGPNEQRIGVDIEKWKMSGLKEKHPDVVSVVANAEHLPFESDTFSRIEIVLPFGELMLPGLQNDHFALLEEKKDEYAQTYPDGWYPEFHRVLKPEGELVIYGDLWIEPEQVLKTSTRFFNIVELKPLSVEEFKALGTTTVDRVLENGQGNPFIEKLGKNWDDTLVKIKLRSTKEIS